MQVPEDRQAQQRFAAVRGRRCGSVQEARPAAAVVAGGRKPDVAGGRKEQLLLLTWRRV